MFDELLGRLMQIDQKATVKTAFGDPVHKNGRTIVPVAKIVYGFGFGGGRNTEKEQDEAESGEGAGGGGGLSVKPVAIVEIDEKATRVQPIVDVNRLALVGMALIAWNVFWITLTIRTRTKARHE